MLTKKEKEIIGKYAKKYNISSVLLFGSSAHSSRAYDIDLAIRGIAPSLFFAFYADLLKYLPKPVDVVDLDKSDDYLTARIEEEGKVIYER